MKLIWWKIRFAWYMTRRSEMGFRFCYAYADAAIENDPESMYEDGPIYYAQEEMANWSD